MPDLFPLSLETLLFGTFSITYAAGIWSIMHVDHPGKPSTKDRTIALISTLMWTLALTHVILTLKLALDGFVDDARGLESITRFVIYVTQTLIGDAFMIFRIFIVWGGRSTIIAIPALLVVSDAVAGYMSIDVAFSAFMPLVFFCLSFFTNVLCSGALFLFSASVNRLTGVLGLIMWRTLRSDEL
ncbi:hypothetical protein NUW54_g1515 [Trametes sanguinea]|uniref:Uncharacterized protein n=1 Tax=Trametes sanguinea TaxID=158606 RepID=A0ACC1Q7I9_9APHY|nr:hypothetical protein NUW54_g1515 [Trametes sanguinea]